jgi:hypothetical protein
MLEEAYGKKTQVTSGIRIFVIAVRLSMPIRAVGWGFSSMLRFSVHYEFIPKGSTVNKEMYVEILSPPRCSEKETTGNKGKQQLVSSARQCTCTSVVGGQKVPWEALKHPRTCHYQTFSCFHD